MNYSITIDRAGQGQLDAARLDGMFRLRHSVFSGRLGWEVRSENEREHDWFDVMGPYYAVASDPSVSARVVGCWRLLPTLGPNMLRDIFPQLLDGAPAPAHEKTWEISRFAIDKDYAGGGCGFSELPADMLRAMLRFAVARGFDSIVGVTSIAIERMLVSLGFKVQRLGRPQRIGNVTSLAFRLPVDADVQMAVCGKSLEVELDRAA
mgnify:CR=1 FL=1